LAITSSNKRADRFSWRFRTALSSLDLGSTRPVLRCAVAALTIAAASGAAAQQRPPDLPNASRIDDRVQRRISPSEAPAPAPSIPELLPPIAAASEVVLAAIIIEGATVFTTEELGPLYSAYLARMVSESEIEELLGRITEKYREAGYALSRAVAAPQALETGVLRIQVVEGFVERVVWDPPDIGGRGLLEAYLAPVLATRPLTLAVLERSLLLVNDLPGVSVKPELKPTSEDPAAYELVLSVDRDRADGAFLFDNRGSPASGPWQALTTAGLNNALGLSERLQVTAFSTPLQPKEVMYGAVRYQQPVGTAGTWLSLDGSYTDAKAGGRYAAFDLRTAGFRISSRAKHPVIRRRDQSLWLYGTFDFYETEQTSAGDSLAEDRMRVVRAGLEYMLRDSWRGSNLVEIETSKGLPILNASRSDADRGANDFWKVSALATRRQGLAEHWTADLSVAGQKSADTLISSEEFSLGGAPFGRAYDPSEISGEDALAASLLLRFDRSLNQPWLRAYRLYGFGDAGVVWDRTGSGTTRRSLASAGLGAQLWLRDWIELGAEVGIPLSGGTEQERYQPRLFLSLSGSF
jgi:hemolysin activation/secretion protein